LAGKSNITAQTKKILLLIIKKFELEQIFQSSNENGDNMVK